MRVQFQAWHKSGVLVSFESEIADAHSADSLLASIAAVGFTASEKIPEKGEETFRIIQLLRREHEDKGRTVQIIDLYTDIGAMAYKVLSVYMNSPKDVSDFEAASGIAIGKVGLSPTTIERGKSRSGDAMLTTVPMFEVVAKPNPKFNPGETDPTKKKPKFLFGRWGDKSAIPAANHTEPTKTASDKPFNRTEAIQAVIDGFQSINTTWSDKIAATEQKLIQAFGPRKFAIDPKLGPGQLDDNELVEVLRVIEITKKNGKKS